MANSNNTSNVRHYLGNPKLKAEGVSYQYSKHEFSEFVKCKNDPIYFIENYVKIIDVSGTIILPKLFDYQKNIINHYLNNKLCITIQPRQTAKTTTVVMLLIWYLLFMPNRVSYILANKGDIAKKILAQVKFSYEQLPFFLQQGVVVWNRTFIELENNSKLFSAATSASGIRGETVTGILFWDEAAHVAPSIANDFFASVYPTVSQPNSNAKFIIASTPKGFNHFYSFWNNAETGKSSFKTFKVKWQEVPGRTQDWADNERKILGDLKFRQEVECSFLGSANSLIDSDTISNLSASIPLQITHNVCIYEQPVENNQYVIVADPSRGTGNDNSAFIVFDITAYPVKQVAKFQDNKTNATALPIILYNFAKKYNDADVLVEINDNGEQVASILYHDLEYENLITFGQFSKNFTLGVRTTKSVKAVGCQTFKDLLENQKVLIQDGDTILEITNFIQKNNSFKADDGYHDDLVMCCVLFSWLSQSPIFKTLFDKDLRKELVKQKIQDLEDDMLPFGFSDNGINATLGEDDFFF